MSLRVEELNVWSPDVLWRHSHAEDFFAASLRARPSQATVSPSQLKHSGQLRVAFRALSS